MVALCNCVRSRLLFTVAAIKYIHSLIHTPTSKRLHTTYIPEYSGPHKNTLQIICRTQVCVCNKSRLSFFCLETLKNRLHVITADVCLYLIGVQVFRPRTPSEAIALCSRLLEYTPTARLTPLEACAHSFFDELRDPNVKLPNGREKPSLFNFTTQGILTQVSLKTESVNICSDAHELVFSYCEMLAHTAFKLFF